MSDSIRERLAVASALIRRGNSALALPLLDEILAMDAECAFAWKERGFAKQFTGDYAGAIADCTEMTRKWPDNPDGYARRATVRRESGDTVGAIEDYSTAIAINPRHPYAIFQRGRIKAAIGDLEGATADFSAHIAIASDGQRHHKLSGLLNRGRARQQMGDLDGAIDDFTAAIPLEVAPIYAPLYRGRVYLELRAYEEAIADFTTAIHGFPLLSNAYRLRAEARAGVGDETGASSDLIEYSRLGGRDLPASE